MANWDDAKKFKAETARTIALTVIGTIAAYQILKPLENRMAQTIFLESTRLTIKAKVVEDFLDSSHAYTAVAYDACKENANKQDRRKFETEGIDKFRNSLRHIDIYFEGKMKADTDKIRCLANDLKNACRGPKDEWNPIREKIKDATDQLVAASLYSIGLHGSQAVPVPVR